MMHFLFLLLVCPLLALAAVPPSQNHAAAIPRSENDVAAAAATAEDSHHKHDGDLPHGDVAYLDAAGQQNLLYHLTYLSAREGVSQYFYHDPDFQEYCMRHFDCAATVGGIATAETERAAQEHGIEPGPRKKLFPVKWWNLSLAASHQAARNAFARTWQIRDALMGELSNNDDAGRSLALLAKLASESAIQHEHHLRDAANEGKGLGAERSSLSPATDDDTALPFFPSVLAKGICYGSIYLCGSSDEAQAQILRLLHAGLLKGTLKNHAIPVLALMRQQKGEAGDDSGSIWDVNGEDLTKALKQEEIHRDSRWTKHADDAKFDLKEETNVERQAAEEMDTGRAYYAASFDEAEGRLWHVTLRQDTAWENPALAKLGYRRFVPIGEDGKLISGWTFIRTPQSMKPIDSGSWRLLHIRRTNTDSTPAQPVQKRSGNASESDGLGDESEPDGRSEGLVKRGECCVLLKWILKGKPKGRIMVDPSRARWYPEEYSQARPYGGARAGGARTAPWPAKPKTGGQASTEPELPGDVQSVSEILQDADGGAVVDTLHRPVIRRVPIGRALKGDNIMFTMDAQPGMGENTQVLSPQGAGEAPSPLELDYVRPIPGSTELIEVTARQLKPVEFFEYPSWWTGDSPRSHLHDDSSWDTLSRTPEEGYFPYYRVLPTVKQQVVSKGEARATTHESDEFPRNLVKALKAEAQRIAAREAAQAAANPDTGKPPPAQAPVEKGGQVLDVDGAASNEAVVEGPAAENLVQGNELARIANQETGLIRSGGTPTGSTRVLSWVNDLPDVLPGPLSEGLGGGLEAFSMMASGLSGAIFIVSLPIMIGLDFQGDHWCKRPARFTRMWNQKAADLDTYVPPCWMPPQGPAAASDDAPSSSAAVDDAWGAAVPTLPAPFQSAPGDDFGPSSTTSGAVVMVTETVEAPESLPTVSLLVPPLVARDVHEPRFPNLTDAFGSPEAPRHNLTASHHPQGHHNSSTHRHHNQTWDSMELEDSEQAALSTACTDAAPPSGYTTTRRADAPCPIQTPFECTDGWFHQHINALPKEVRYPVYCSQGDLTGHARASQMGCLPDFAGDKCRDRFIAPARKEVVQAEKRLRKSAARAQHEQARVNKEYYDAEMKRWKEEEKRQGFSEVDAQEGQ